MKASIADSGSFEMGVDRNRRYPFWTMGYQRRYPLLVVLSPLLSSLLSPLS